MTAKANKTSNNARSALNSNRSSPSPAKVSPAKGAKKKITKPTSESETGTESEEDEPEDIKKSSKKNSRKEPVKQVAKTKSKNQSKKVDSEIVYNEDWFSCKLGMW